MADMNLNDVPQQDFDNAKLLYKEILSTASPGLDLRDGTAISDLVVNPAALAAGYMGVQTTALRSQMSFLLMAQDPELATPEAMNNLAANYDLVRKAGLKAAGSAMALLSSNQEYTVASGYALANGGKNYVTTQAWPLKRTVTDASSQLEIRQNSSGQYYVILPLQAETMGSAYNLSAGSSLEPVKAGMANLSSAYVYQEMGGGTDDESNTEFISRIPSAMSHSEFSSLDSISTRLMNQIPEVSLVSVSGMGDSEMLRNKHNVFGLGMGGYTDVYVKSFRQPFTQVVLVSASKVSQGVYSFSLLPSDAPGLYCIRSVTSPDSLLTQETSMTFPAIGSLPFSETRRAYGLGDTFHDFGSDAEDQNLETAYSMWQAVDVVVTDVPPVVSGGSSSYPDTLTLKVEVYSAPRLDSVQELIDSPEVRSKESDCVVRCAVLGFVSVSAAILKPASSQSLLSDMTQAVADYVNGKVFGEMLTSSQIDSVLHGFDIEAVQDMVLETRIRGADGVWRSIGGSAMDVMAVYDAGAMVTDITTVLVADPRHIFLTERTV